MLRELRNKLPIMVLCWMVLMSDFSHSFGQNNFVFTPSTSKGTINWQQFPNFSLPFLNVYTGPRVANDVQEPLKHGFSHLARYNQFDSDLPVKNRAFLWYGVASVAGQPWYELESPWDNNLASYQSYWKGSMQSFANEFNNTRGQTFPQYDFLVLDIERERPTNNSILTLKQSSGVSQKYKNLSDSVFIERYKRDIMNLYAQPMSYLWDSGFPKTTKIASYSDAPIKNQEFPIGYSWKAILDDPTALNYYMKDSLTQKVGGPFYAQNTHLTPSAYLCYEYRNFPNYSNVAYQLFQVEANRARSNKDIILFEWLGYNRCQNSNYAFNQSLPKHLIEAQAIMPYFSGAKGIFLWEGPLARQDTMNLNKYEYFVNGLYRLSAYKNFFTRDYSLYIPKTAYQHFQEYDPIWRAVIKGDSVLVAAVNEFANDNATTNLNIRIGSWTKNIALKGKETFLQAFALEKFTEKILVYPNPSVGPFNLEYQGSGSITGTVQLYDLLGNIRFEANWDDLTNESFVVNRRLINPKLPTGIYILRVNNQGHLMEQKVFLTNN
ncbi:T9SS type A sorting domain-containing protein [Cellulophaga sp. BC115SP]|uniref:T9SS type A sorting domain-containing protein n=1 Tax=Cellulophaga sp. BC115SP TaxID=2683263 RepID=UPI001412A36D|nr:T9SS type A sorting domain-containing protein [Cellulophaga sp. BC115SP]NBB29866.1 T9SS type A sorting domain-containing protein [Cellulophaga sp. BC115SP]